MDLFWTQVIMGLIAGGIFAAYAIGLTVTFGIIDIINFAHGGFVLIGAYTTVVLVNAGVSFAPAVVAYAAALRRQRLPIAAPAIAGDPLR